MTITGVQSRPQLNGSVCLVDAWDHSKHRYTVRLPDSTHIALKPANLPSASLPGAASTSAHSSNNASTSAAELKVLLGEHSVTSHNST